MAQHIRFGDNDEMAKGMTLCTAAGAKVLTVSFAAAIGAWVKGELLRDRPDVLLSDIGMPGEDGYALIAQVRARERAPDILPAIALTAVGLGVDAVGVIFAPSPRQVSLATAGDRPCARAASERLSRRSSSHLDAFSVSLSFWERTSSM